MSAQLETHDENGERIPMPAERVETLANITQFAESLDRLLLRDAKDGQLWERVGEGNVSARPWSQLERGFPVKHARGYSPSGIIRAGERVR